MEELGSRVKDSITGFEGFAVSRTEYLYGCVRERRRRDAGSAGARPVNCRGRGW